MQVKALAEGINQRLRLTPVRRWNIWPRCVFSQRRRSSFRRTLRVRWLCSWKLWFASSLVSFITKILGTLKQLMTAVGTTLGLCRDVLLSALLTALISQTVFGWTTESRRRHRLLMLAAIDRAGGFVQRSAGETTGFKRPDKRGGRNRIINEAVLIPQICFYIGRPLEDCLPF